MTKKYFCDICEKEFKWYNEEYYFGNYKTEGIDMCNNCYNKIIKFMKELRENKENDK